MDYHQRSQSSAWRRVMVFVAAIGSAAVTYLVASAFTSHDSLVASRPQPLARQAPVPAQPPPAPFAGGTHLIAYVVVASDCGFCSEKFAKQALAMVRPSLRSAHGQAFGQVSVIGVVMDADLMKAMQYVADLGRGETVFDQLSLGGGWLNDDVAHLIWRDGLGPPSVPQILVFERYVGTEAWPRALDVRPDSLVLTVTGRDELIRWVGDGTPLRFRPRRP